MLPAGLVVSASRVAVAGTAVTQRALHTRGNGLVAVRRSARLIDQTADTTGAGGTAVAVVGTRRADHRT